MPMDSLPLTETLADQFVDGWLAHLRSAGYSDRTIERAARQLADAALGVPEARNSMAARRFLAWVRRHTPE